MRRCSRHACSLVLAAAGIAAGCVPLPGNRQLSRETVARKEAEKTLVSDQGATCRVKADAFDKVNIGDVHSCVWKNVDADATPRAATATPPVQDQAPRRAPGRP